MDTPPFSELGLPDTLLAAIETLGYERPSPIQAMSIPPALLGKDLVGPRPRDREKLLLSLCLRSQSST
jgi:superfamily II DNA/RNA helicase